MNTQKVRESTSFYERSFQTSNYYYFPFFVHPEEKSRKIRASAGGNRRSTFAYDVNGNVTNDATNSLQTSYNLINLPVQTKSGSTVKANYSYLSDGAKASVLNASGTGYDYNGTFTYSHASGETRTLESVAFGGGRIRKNGSTYAVDYYVTDHLGSVRAIVNASGAIVEQNDYYPFGTRQQNGLTPLSANRWRFSGKEGYDNAFGIALDDFGARRYDRTAWTSIDPLAEKYYSLSPYAYCAGNPVNFIDPEGESTQVVQLSNGQYQVTGFGDPFDNDYNIYVGYYDEEGNWIRTNTSIGYSLSAISFYCMDENKEGWMVGAIIDINDESGRSFTRRMFSSWMSIGDYARLASDEGILNFKKTNGTILDLYNSPIDYYRGMPFLWNGEDGRPLIASARDIGNVAAGYYAGINGLSWKWTRRLFDEYDVNKKESLSSQTAQLFGWRYGHSFPFLTKASHLLRSIPSIHEGLKTIYRK